MKLRIGEGWDTHALVTGRPLILGGVTIPHSHGLLGHSDADALAHAIVDALFRAAAYPGLARPRRPPQKRKRRVTFTTNVRLTTAGKRSPMRVSRPSL